jgi:hypothetical protein
MLLFESLVETFVKPGQATVTWGGRGCNSQGVTAKNIPLFDALRETSVMMCQVRASLSSRKNGARYMNGFGPCSGSGAWSTIEEQSPL